MLDIEKRDRRPTRRLEWIVGAGLVAGSGVTSQILDTQYGAHNAAHLVFAVFLNVGVVCRFRYGLWASAHGCLEEIQAFSRQTTRRVYGLLYALMFVKLTLNLTTLGHLTQPESFQPYLASGLAAVLLIRALAQSHWRRCCAALPLNA